MQKIKKQEKQYYKLNLQSLLNSGFIALTTHNNGITMKIKPSIEQKVEFAQLNKINFAYIIQNGSEFKRALKYNDCVLEVVNDSDHDSRYGFVYTFDHAPIQIGESIQFYLPSVIPVYL